MYAKSTRPSAKRDDQIARSNLRAAREACDENVTAKRADFFNYVNIVGAKSFILNEFCQVSFCFVTLLTFASYIPFTILFHVSIVSNLSFLLRSNWLEEFCVYDSLCFDPAYSFESDVFIYINLYTAFPVFYVIGVIRLKESYMQRLLLYSMHLYLC